MDPARGPARRAHSSAARPAARLAGRRIVAWCADWLVISGYAAVLVPLGLLLSGHVGRLSPIAGNAVGLVVLVVPMVIWLAAWERRPGGASPGKRMLRLRVEAQGAAALGWRRSLVRNALKVGLPWELGHTMAFAFADPHATRSSILVGSACGVVSGALAVWYVVSLFVGFGRTPYDRASASRVIAAGALRGSRG